MFTMANQLNTVPPFPLKRKRTSDDVDTRSEIDRTTANPRKAAVGRLQPSTRRRSIRGSLKLLLQMPLDIIFEVSDDVPGLYGRYCCL